MKKIALIVLSFISLSAFGSKGDYVKISQNSTKTYLDEDDALTELNASCDKSKPFSVVLTGEVNVHVQTYIVYCISK
jgi:hypothetical protein